MPVLHGQREAEPTVVAVEEIVLSSNSVFVCVCGVGVEVSVCVCVGGGHTLVDVCT